MDNRTFGTEQQNTEFKLNYEKKGEHVLAKMDKILLKVEMGKKQVKDYKKWAKNFGHSILGETMWILHYVIT